MGITANPTAPMVEVVGGGSSQEPTTPYRSIAAEVVGAAAEGQTIYFRAVYRTGLHKLSLVTNFLVIIAAIGLAIGQIWGMAIKNLVIMEIIMRSYLIGISGLIVLNELEVTTILKNSPILYTYVWRGLFYTFIGALGTLCNDLGNDNYRNNWNNNYNNNNYNNNGGGYVTFVIPSLERGIEIFIGFTARLLFAMGCLYFIYGCLMLQKKVERDVEAFRHRLELSEKDFGHQDVLRSKIGGRLAEEVGMTGVV